MQVDCTTSSGKGFKLNKKQAIADLAKYGCTEENHLFNPSLFMIGCLVVGAIASDVALWSGIPMAECKVYRKRLKDGGIIKGRHVLSNWRESVVFVADAMVAGGMLLKRGDEYMDVGSGERTNAVE